MKLPDVRHPNADPDCEACGGKGWLVSHRDGSDCHPEFNGMHAVERCDECLPRLHQQGRVTTMAALRFLSVFCPDCQERQWHRAERRDNRRAWTGSGTEEWWFFDVTCPKCKHTWGPKAARPSQLKTRYHTRRFNPYGYRRKELV